MLKHERKNENENDNAGLKHEKKVLLTIYEPVKRIPNCFKTILSAMRRTHACLVCQNRIAILILMKMSVTWKNT